MEEIFYGDWNLSISDNNGQAKNSPLKARWIISNSINKDGIYYWGQAYSFDISGRMWQVVTELDYNGIWQQVKTFKQVWVTSENLFKLISPEYDKNYLNGFGNRLNLLFENNAIFKCLNPDIILPKSKGQPFDFTYKKR